MKRDINHLRSLIVRVLRIVSIVHELQIEIKRHRQGLAPKAMGGGDGTWRS